MEKIDKQEESIVGMTAAENESATVEAVKPARVYVIGSQKLFNQAQVLLGAAVRQNAVKRAEIVLVNGVNALPPHLRPNSSGVIMVAAGRGGCLAGWLTRQQYRTQGRVGIRRMILQADTSTC